MVTPMTHYNTEQFGQDIDRWTLVARLSLEPPLYEDEPSPGGSRKRKGFRGILATVSSPRTPMTRGIASRRPNAVALATMMHLEMGPHVR